MATRHVIFVSDTHLSPDAPEAQENWAAVIRYATAAAPDLVIHLGDLSVDGARNPADLDHARGQLEMLSVGWTAVPGNHDIGDNPLPGRPDGLRCSRISRSQPPRASLPLPRPTDSGLRRRGTDSPICSRAGCQPCSSAVTCISLASFTSTGPIMSGCPRRGLSCPTTRSQSSALSGPECCRWRSEPDSPRSRPSWSLTASGS